MLFVLTTLRGCVHRAVSAKTKLSLGHFKMDRVEMMNCVLITERLNVPFSYPDFDAELGTRLRCRFSNKAPQLIDHNFPFTRNLLFCTQSLSCHQAHVRSIKMLTATFNTTMQRSHVSLFHEIAHDLE